MPQMIWKFVDSPVTTPATLFDMNNYSTGCIVDIGQNGEKFDLSPPPLRRIKANNNLSDGSLNTSITTDNRILKFSLGIGPGTKAFKTNIINNLAAELYKPRNLLMYQPDSSRPPVFFRTYRSDDYILKNRGSGVQEIWNVDCTVEAEPFAIGTRVDLSQVTINNDPGAASGNKTFWDITGIIGDVPTPAFMQISDIGARHVAFMGTRCFNNPTALTLFAQAESATLGADTTAQSDSGASPGSGTSRTSTSFSTTPDWAARLTFPSLPSATNAAALRGRYRVIARINGVTATANVSLRWRQTATADTIPGPIVTRNLVVNPWSFIDLGVIEFPAPQMTPEYMGYSNLQSQHATSPLTIEAKRNSGTGGLLIDWVYLMPATERLCAIFQEQGLSSGSVILDGPNDATYAIASGSTPFGSTRIVDNKQGIVTRQGGLPWLVPGLTNRIYFLHNENTNNTTETVTVSYWPRWRVLAS